MKAPCGGQCPRRSCDDRNAISQTTFISVTTRSRTLSIRYFPELTTRVSLGNDSKADQLNIPPGVCYYTASLPILEDCKAHFNSVSRLQLARVQSVISSTTARRLTNIPCLRPSEDNIFKSWQSEIRLSKTTLFCSLMIDHVRSIEDS
jgi:hypothetical protein